METHHQYERERAEIVVALGRDLGAMSERGAQIAMQPFLHSLFKGRSRTRVFMSLVSYAT